MSTFILLSPSSALAQRSRHADTWNFGIGCRVSWNDDASSLSVGVDPRISTGEGSASFSDPETGELLIYSDGSTVWNAGGTQIATGLAGNSSSLHSAVIVPRPLTPGHVYVITHGFGSSASVAFREFDVYSGSGSALGSNTEIPLDGGAATAREGMLVIPHSNGLDSWVLVSGNNSVFVIPVTASGLGSATKIDTMVPIWGNGWGVFAASNAGDRLIVSSNDGGLIASFDFDASAGSLSNRTVIRSSLDSQYYGGAFSPDDSKFYFSTLTSPGPSSRVYQYDFASDAMTLLNEETPRYTNAQARLAPDGKVYVATGNSAVTGLSVINRPNELGAAADFRYGAVPMAPGCNPTLGLPQTVSPRQRLVLGLTISGPSGTVSTAEVTPTGTANLPDGTVVDVEVGDGTTTWTCSATVAGGTWSCGMPVGPLSPETEYEVSASVGPLEADAEFETSECFADDHCDDGNECTANTCSDAGACVHPPLEAGASCTAGVCDGSASCVACIDSEGDGGTDPGCDGDAPLCSGTGPAAQCVQCLNASHCDDGNACTEDTCEVNRCSNPSKAAGTLCDGGACNGAPSMPQCLPCVDTEAGSGRDPGCGLLAPVCDESGDAPDCVECLDDSDCPDAVCEAANQSCAPCVDTASDGGLDQGCGIEAPICTGAGDARRCVACVDDASGATADSGCDAGAPLCDDSSPAHRCEVCIAGDGSPDEGCANPMAICDEGEAPRQCVGCLSDDDCEAGNICGPSGTCAPGCRGDADCTPTPETPVCDADADVCVECQTQEHCEGSEVCSPDHVCVQCADDDDCEGGQLCDAASNACVECLSERHCPEGLVCADNACLPECRSDADCPEGVCDAGVCRVCLRDSDCEGDTVCREGQCGETCSEDADCAAAATPACDDAAGICVECTEDDDCEGRCDAEASECIPTCSEAADCTGVRNICNLLAGECVECTDDTNCGAGAACDPSRGLCVECTEDRECLSGESCFAGACLGCRQDAECGEAMVCDPDLMSCQSGCTDNDDCTNPRLPHCVRETGQCEECAEDSHCSGGEVCTGDLRCEAQCAIPGTPGCFCRNDDDCEGSCDSESRLCVASGNYSGGAAACSAVRNSPPGDTGSNLPAIVLISAVAFLFRRKRSSM